MLIVVEMKFTAPRIGDDTPINLLLPEFDI
jgi:hypothetical protein